MLLCKRDMENVYEIWVSLYLNETICTYKTGMPARFGLWNIVVHPRLWFRGNLNLFMDKDKDVYDNRIMVRENINGNFVGRLKKKEENQHLLSICYVTLTSLGVFCVFLFRSWNNTVDFILLPQVLLMRKLISNGSKHLEAQINKLGFWAQVFLIVGTHFSILVQCLIFNQFCYF